MSTAPKLPAFEDERRYSITVKKAEPYGDTTFVPRRARYIVKGKVAKAIKTAIATAEAI